MQQKKSAPSQNIIFLSDLTFLDIYLGVGGGGVYKKGKQHCEYKRERNNFDWNHNIFHPQNEASIFLSQTADAFWRFAVTYSKFEVSTANVKIQYGT